MPTAERYRASSGRNHENSARVLVSYRTISHAWAFHPDLTARELFDGIEDALGAGTRAASRGIGQLAKAVEVVLGGILNFFGGSEPKLTAQQTHDKARAEGNEETLHARAAAEAEQTTRADQDWRIFEQNSQQRQQQHDAEMGLSERFGTPPPGGSSGRERDDRGYERER